MPAGREVSDRYFSVMREMNEQMAQRRYAAALARIRDGLECAPDALVYFKERHPSIGLPPSIPFIDPKAGAVVALFGAKDTIDKMAELVKWIQVLEPGRKVPDVARYKADAQLVATLRNTLEKSSICDLNSLKRGVSQPDRSRVARMIDWMEKNNELSVHKEGNPVIVRWGLAPLKPVVSGRTFRLDASPVAVPVGTLAEDHVRAPATGAHDRFKQRPAAHLKSGRTVMQTVDQEGVRWAFGKPRRAPGGGELTEYVRITDTVAPAHQDLPYAVIRAISTARRDYIVLMDRQLTVHVLDLNGEERLSFALKNNPDIVAASRRLRSTDKLYSAIRGVDVSLRDSSVAFCFVDTFWWFTAQEELVCCARLGDGDERILNKNEFAVALSPGQALEPAYDATDSIEGVEWLYFLQLSDVSDTLWLATYHGRLLRVTRDLVVDGAWQLPSGFIERLDEEPSTVMMHYGDTTLGLI